MTQEEESGGWVSSPIFKAFRGDTRERATVDGLRAPCLASGSAGSDRRRLNGSPVGPSSVFPGNSTCLMAEGRVQTPQPIPPAPVLPQPHPPPWPQPALSMPSPLCWLRGTSAPALPISPSLMTGPGATVAPGLLGAAVQQPTPGCLPFLTAKHAVPVVWAGRGHSAQGQRHPCGCS